MHVPGTSGVRRVKSTIAEIECETSRRDRRQGGRRVRNLAGIGCRGDERFSDAKALRTGRVTGGVQQVYFDIADFYAVSSVVFVKICV